MHSRTCLKAVAVGLAAAAVAPAVNAAASDDVQAQIRALQEIVQRRFGVTPRYGLLESEGPDHDRTFRVEITIQGEPRGLGVGKSKKGAEQAAAEVALAALQVQPPDASGDGDGADASDGDGAET